MIALKMAARNFLPRCNAFFYRIPIESLKICNSNEMHLGKNSSPPSLAQSSILALRFLSLGRFRKSYGKFGEAWVS